MEKNNEKLNYDKAVELRRALLLEGPYYNRSEENRFCMYFYGKEALKRQVYKKPAGKNCPVCKWVIKSQDTYCRECGTRIRPHKENKNRIGMEKAYKICETADLFGCGEGAYNEGMYPADCRGGRLTQARQIAAKYITYDAARISHYDGNFGRYCPTCHFKKIGGGKFCPRCGQRISYAIPG